MCRCHMRQPRLGSRLLCFRLTQGKRFGLSEPQAPLANRHDNGKALASLGCSEEEGTEPITAILAHGLVDGSAQRMLATVTDALCTDFPCPPCLFSLQVC